MDDFAAIARLLDALRPWLGHLVIVGGWAHRLHRFHPLAHPPAYAALRTKDADLAFSTSAPLMGDIAAALKAADFQEDFSGEHTRPITQYRLRADDEGFFAEFLTPLHGSEVKRNGQADITMKRAGITAQKLRHVDLLLARPWAVRLTKDIGVPVQSPVDVMLPNPVSFIAQKLLIEKYRTSDKKAQDALYIHDTLELFGGEVSALRTLWHEEIRPTLPERTAKNVERLQREQFGTVTDVIRNAARMPQDRTLLPDRIQAACTYGLEEVFGRQKD
ncbi:MAG: GSU2403 family nucleotidyltransferase fold protein [Vicinamibacterales bacterium]